MVLEHQGLPNFPNASLHQLYAAAAAAHLVPRNRATVPPWSFLQFSMPGVLSNPFLTRPRFIPSSPSSSASNQASLAGLTGLSAIGNANGLSLSQHNLNAANRSTQGPPSECSNDEGGKFFPYYQSKQKHYF